MRKRLIRTTVLRKSERLRTFRKLSKSSWERCGELSHGNTSSRKRAS
jgi:hypothetical protein